MERRNMQFICPKNYKSGKYFMSKYRKIDVVIIVTGTIFGMILTLTMITIANGKGTFFMGIMGAVIGMLIAGTVIILTLNIPYYHNVLEWLLNVIKYCTKTRRYAWKGINYNEDEEEE